MRRVWQVTSLIAMLSLIPAGCEQPKAATGPKFEQHVEHFDGLAKNTETGARLLLDNGSDITCIVETESGETGWPADVNNTRIRVEGYRIRSDSADPNGIVLRCVNWTPATRQPAGGENQTKKRKPKTENP